MKIEFYSTTTNKKIKELRFLQSQIYSLDFELGCNYKSYKNKELKLLARERKDYFIKFESLKNELVKKILLGEKK